MPNLGLGIIVLQLLDQLHGIVPLQETALLTALLTEMEHDLEIIPGILLTRKETTVPVKNISPLVKRKSDLTVGVY